jgi:hypothetical protein
MMHIEKKERFLEKIEAPPRRLEEILNDNDLSSVKAQYQTGKEMGFEYARSAPYSTIKPFEKLINGWNDRDNDAIGSAVDRANELEPVKKLIDQQKGKGSYVIFVGFLNGIMEFIKEEYRDYSEFDIVVGIFKPEIKGMPLNLYPVFGDMLHGKL